MVRATSLLVAACALEVAVASSAAAIPAYALKYAPYTYLFSGEVYFPSDISTHLAHCTPEVNFTAIQPSVTLQTLDNVTADAYLTSNDNVQTNPAWLLSANNKPKSGYSGGPATIIVADKGSWVDVFYFYFYSYNHGLVVLFQDFGDHVGDWEHSMIRFVNGTPEYLYLSEHSGGSAYEWSALNFTGVRPNTYVANGTHANYATVGHQAYEGGFLAAFGVYDQTDAGFYWDVTQNYRGFFFDNSTSTFTTAAGTDVGGSEEPAEGADWLYWLGHWGDEQYPRSDPRQNCDLEALTGECHYVSGPTGPYDKNLGRTAVCQNESKCDIKTSLS